MSLERADIQRALDENEGRMDKAARALGASRRTLQNRMRLYGMPTGTPGRKRRKLHYRKHRYVAAGLGAAAVVAAVALAAKARGSSV